MTMTTLEIKKLTPAQRATRRIVELFNDHIFYIDYHSGNATSTGRTDRYRVLCVNVNIDVSCIADVTKHVALATGSRYSDKTQTINISGCGYSKKDHLRDLLVSLAFKYEKYVRFCN